MADAPSVASTAVSFLSISLSFVATLYSSTYETERSLRELKELSAGLEKLQQCLRMLGDHEQRSRAPSKASRSAERECRTVLQCPTLLQDNSSAPTDLLSRVQEMTRHCGSIAFARSSEPTEAHCRQQTLYTPLFWRLQSWITKTIVDHIPSSAHKLCAISSAKHPTPDGLLLSWVVLAVATATYYRSQPEVRSEGYCIVGSMLVACVIGILEGSGVATVILIDIPWCLTIGMLLHGIVCGTSRSLAAGRIRWNAVPRGLPPRVLLQDMEKMAGKEQLF